MNKVVTLKLDESLLKQSFQNVKWQRKSRRESRENVAEKVARVMIFSGPLLMRQYLTNADLTESELE